METKKKKRGFMDGYKKYDTSNGFGNRQEWMNAFYARLGFEQALEVLGEDDPLVLFGLKADATWADVSARWRELAVKHHPDKGGDPVVFKKYGAAFEVLERRYGK
jgi:DnaJ-domain-containing protein 1